MTVKKINEFDQPPILNLSEQQPAVCDKSCMDERKLEMELHKTITFSAEYENDFNRMNEFVKKGTLDEFHSSLHGSENEYVLNSFKTKTDWIRYAAQIVRNDEKDNIDLTSSNYLMSKTLSEKYLDSYGNNFGVLQYNLFKYRKRFVTMAMLLFVIFSVFNVKALKNAVFDVIIERFPTHSVAYIESGQDNNTVKQMIIQKPCYIPAGYEKTQEIVRETLYMERYEDGEGGYLMYEQFPVNVILYYDTEDAIEETLYVKGYKAIYVQKLSHHFVLYNDGETNFKFISNGSQEELIKVMESLE